MQKVWVITSANRGLGRAFTEAAPKGERIRNPSSSTDQLAAVLTLHLDLNDRLAAALLNQHHETAE